MSDDQRILVRGEAERRAPADLATLTVIVQVDDVDQASAFRQASDVAQGVDDALHARSDALGTLQGAFVVVQPTSRWVDGEQQRTGWRASRTTTLDVTDLGQVTPLLSELVAAGAVVRGPAWQLRAEHPVLAEVQTAAAADARARAEHYAAGLGIRVGRVDWLAEPGLRHPQEGYADMPRGSSLKVLADMGADPELPVEPAELTVTASVEVGFAIER